MATDRPNLAAQIEEMTKVATNPVMLNLLKEIEAAPSGSKFDAARPLITREALAAKGLELPPEGRVSLREFEDRTQHVIKKDEMLAPPIVPADDGGTLCVSVGYVVCVSYGS
jgi:hypothetical protein